MLEAYLGIVLGGILCGRGLYLGLGIVFNLVGIFRVGKANFFPHRSFMTNWTACVPDAPIYIYTVFPESKSEGFSFSR